MVRPDPVQPRRVLPEAIHFAFHSNRLTPTQALRELVQLVQIAARQRGRPFNSVLNCCRAPMMNETRKSTCCVFRQKNNCCVDLVNLAVTIRDDGQVNPLTVVDVSQGVTRLFRIETGERRYWATWLLRDFIPEYTGRRHDPLHHHSCTALLRVSPGEREHGAFWLDGSRDGASGGAAAPDRSWL